MTRRYGALILVPGLTLAVFLVALLRQHGYESVRTPAWLLAGAGVVAALAACWLACARLLERLAGLAPARALRLDLYSYLPFLALAAYFLPAVHHLPNVGTLLASASLAACLTVKAAVLAYQRRAALQALWARPYLVPGMILGGGLLARFSLIAANRFHADEALYSHWGLLIASGRDLFLRSEMVDKPPVFPYALALAFKLFGPTETAARLPNVLASVATIAVVYALGRELYGRRTGALAALFLALSPFDIQFAPTAFTDPLMVALAWAACLAALRGRHLAAGLAMGLAVMTKPTALFFVPLWLLLAGRALWRTSWLAKPLGPGLRLGAGFTAIAALVGVWDGVIRVGCVKTLSAASLHYGGMRIVGPAELWPRLVEWLGQARYLTGSAPLNAALLAGVPLLLAWGLWRRGRGWAADWALAGFAVCFVAAHTALSFSVWDRYLLPLAPAVALLLARVVLVPYEALRTVAHRGAAAYGLALALGLAAALLRPAHTALRYGFPVGSDHGAFQGIDDLAGYLRGSAPPGTVVFHQWLDWQFSFYLFDVPVRALHYSSPEALLAMVQEAAAPEYDVVLADWDHPEALLDCLESAGWALEEAYRTWRPDGTVSFTVCRIVPAAQ